MKKRISDFSLINKDFEYIRSIDVTSLDFKGDILPRFINAPKMMAHNIKLNKDGKSAYIRNIVDFDDVNLCMNFRVSNHLPILSHIVDDKCLYIPINKPHSNICLMFLGTTEDDMIRNGHRTMGREQCTIEVGPDDFEYIKNRLTDYKFPYRIHILIPNFTKNDDVDKLIDTTDVWIKNNSDATFKIPELSEHCYYRSMEFEGMFKACIGKPDKIAASQSNKKKTISEDVELVGDPIFGQMIKLGTVNYMCGSESLSYDVILKPKRCHRSFIKAWIEYAKCFYGEESILKSINKRINV